MWIRQKDEIKIGLQSRPPLVEGIVASKECSIDERAFFPYTGEVSRFPILGRVERVIWIACPYRSVRSGGRPFSLMV